MMAPLPTPVIVLCLFGGLFVILACAFVLGLIAQAIGTAMAQRRFRRLSLSTRRGPLPPATARALRRAQYARRAMLPVIRTSALRTSVGHEKVAP